MGTKNEPGQFDCYANAEPDEPMFILLARDPLAPLLVEMWAQLRAESSTEDDSAMIEEAEECAESMREWRAEHRPTKRLLVLSRTPQSDKAVKAIAAMMKRIATDPRVAYLVGPFSDTYERLVEAYAEIVGEDLESFKTGFEASLKTQRVSPVGDPV